MPTRTVSERVERRPRRFRFLRFKRSERNFAAAIGGIVAIVTFCTALVEPNWFYIDGGTCATKKETLHYIGTTYFFTTGNILVDSHQNINYTIGDNYLENCFDFQVIDLMRLIITLCFCGALSSLCGFILDLLGPSHKCLKAFRRNGVFAIVTAVLCVVILFVSNKVANELFVIQESHRPKHTPGSKITVQFSISYYLIVAAGFVSVVTAALNNFQIHSNVRLRIPHRFRHRRSRRSEGNVPLLLDEVPMAAEYDGIVPPAENVPTSNSDAPQTSQTVARRLLTPPRLPQRAPVARPSTPVPEEDAPSYAVSSTHPPAPPPETSSGAEAPPEYTP